MQELLRMLAAWKGLTLEPGTELRLELAGFPSGGKALLLLLLAVFALGLVLTVYRRDGKDVPVGRRVVLGLMRAVAVVSALILVLEPSLVAVKREVRPGHSILLLDVSQSMNRKDAFRRQDVADRAEAWRALGVADPGGTSRLDLAKALLAKGDQQLLAELAQKNRVLAYGFSSTAEPLPLAGDAAKNAAPAPAAAHAHDGTHGEVPRLDLAAIAADGRQTNLGGALRGALEKSRDATVASVIVLSDGRRTMGPQGAEVARLLAQRKVPATYVLPVGDPSETQSVELTRIEAPEKVLQKDPFRLKGHLATQGYEPTSVVVKLIAVPQGGAAAAGETVQQKTVAIGGTQPDVLVDFEEITASAPGVLTYRVEVQPPTGEALVPERHQKHAQVEVLAEQTRVLLLSGSPNYEYRTLVNFLIRDKTIDVSCWLQSADQNFPQDGDTPLKTLPIDKKDLAAFDVFLLIDPDPQKLTKEWCQIVAKLVEEDGTGLWWVSSDKHSLEAMRDEATTHVLAELLPVVPDLKKADTEIFDLGRGFDTQWPLGLTPQGEAHVVTRLLEARDDNRLLWPRLPGHYWFFPVLRPKPAATVLIGHASPRLKTPDGPMPLYAVHFLGAARILYSGIDETYRWRAFYEEAYQRFWVKGLRYLWEGKLAAGNTRFKIRLSGDKVELGEPVKITIDAQDEAFRPLVQGSIDLRLRRDTGPAEQLRVTAVAESPGHFETLWQPPAVGFYRLGQTEKSGKDVEATLQVVPAAIEKEGPVDLQELGAIAQAPGAKLLRTPQELLEVAGKIPSLTATDVFKTPHAVWDSWATVVWVLLWLALEWWFRKRSNLL